MMGIHANIAKHKSSLTFLFPSPFPSFFFFFLSSSLWSLAKHLVVPLSNPEYKELIANSLEVLTKCCHGLASHPGNIRILSPVHANFIFKNWDAFYQMRHLTQISTPLLSRSNPSPILNLALYCLQISLANWSKTAALFPFTVVFLDRVKREMDFVNRICMTTSDSVVSCSK